MPTDNAPAEKLTALLETLDPADRREITAWLLGRTFRRDWAAGAALQHELLQRRERAGEHELSQRRELASGLAGEGHQLVNIRLPVEQHERLRAWCGEHNFSIAAVIRGLVERFLEEQDRAPGR